MEKPNCTCGCRNYKRNGRHRNGRQRLKCRQCGATVTVGRQPADRRLSKRKEEQIRAWLTAGVSTRKIAAILHVSTDAVQRRREDMLPIIDLHEPVTTGGCNYCGNRIEKPREFQRRTARVKHQFCGHDCYTRFYLVTDESRLQKYLERKLNHAKEEQSDHQHQPATECLA